MSRGLSTEMQAVAAAEVVRPVLLVEAAFDSGNVNLWNGIGDLTYSSTTYIGAGNLLSVGAIEESSDLVANGAKVVLSGIGEPLISKARDEKYQGRQLDIYLGAMDENGSVISSPVKIFSGFMDVMVISDSGQSAEIAISVENRLIEFERTRVRRNTAEDQKIDYPNDKGFEFVTEIQEKDIVWGRTISRGSTGSGNVDGEGVSLDIQIR